MLRGLAISTVVAAIVGAATFESVYSTHSVRRTATSACQSAALSGTLVGTHSLGPVCVPNPFAVTCFSDTAGFSPLVEVTVTGCAPNPA